jgi:hypothetical protein
VFVERIQNICGPQGESSKRQLTGVGTARKINSPPAARPAVRRPRERHGRGSVTGESARRCSPRHGRPLSLGGTTFRAAAVMACDDEVLPLRDRNETVGDDADLQEVYDTERQMLYVACTRARDFLCVTSLEPASEFLDDFIGRA